MLERAPNELPVEEIPDDRLRLIFTCCHPALPFPARVALTLRTLADMSTAEIARAFRRRRRSYRARPDHRGHQE